MFAVRIEVPTLLMLAFNIQQAALLHHAHTACLTRGIFCKLRKGAQPPWMLADEVSYW